MSRYRFRLAGADDDDALRRRMASDVMPGPITLSFRREPSYFAGSSVQGDQGQIIVCESADGTLVGLGARFRISTFVNGVAKTIGYLADLRAEPSVRGGMLLARGYRYLSQLHQQDPLPFYTTMVLSDNTSALRLLSSGRAGLPRYHPLGQVLTPAIHLDLVKSAPGSTAWRVDTARSEDMAEVMGFIQQHFRHKQLARQYSHDDLHRPGLAGLQASDFYLLRSSGKLLAVAACWDQSSFRQTHVEAYRGSLAGWRPIYNLMARWSPLKSLPEPGNAIPYFYLSFVAIRDNDPELFAHLWRCIYRDRRRGPWHYAIVSFHQRDPLAQVLTRYRRIKAGGYLFLVHYADGHDAVQRLDNRLPYVDAAWL